MADSSFSYEDAAGAPAVVPAAAPAPAPFTPEESAFLGSQNLPANATVMRSAHTGDLVGYHSPTDGLTVFVGAPRGGMASDAAGATPTGPAVTAPAASAQPDDGGFSYQDAASAMPTDSPAKPTSESLGFIEGVTKPLDNAAHWLDKLPPLHALDQGAAALLGMPTTDQAISNRQQAFRAAEQTAQPGKIGNFAGSIVGTLPTLAMPGGILAQGGAGGALLTDHPDSLADTAKDAAAGAAGAWVGGKVLGAVGRAASPRVRPDVQTLVDAGVPLTPGQIAGGGLKRVEDAMTSWPVLGDAIRSAQRRGLEGFNRAAANRALEPLGEQMPMSVNVGRDGVGFVQDRLGRAYDSIAPQLRAVFDQPFVDGIVNLRSQIAPEALDALPTFDRIVRDEVLQRATRTGAAPVGGNALVPPGTANAGGATQTQIDGVAAKHAQEAISAEIRGLRPSADPKTRAVVRGLEGLQGILHDAIERHSPPGTAGRLANINRGFAQFVRVQGASANASEKADGLFTASQLGRAVKIADKTTRKGSYARGDALMQDLAAAGDRVLPSTVPDSGTPLRLLISELPMLVGFGAESAHFAPQLAGTLLAGGAAGLPYTRLGQRLATSLMTRRPWTPGQSAAVLEALRPFMREAGAVTGARASAPHQLPQLPSRGR